MSDKINLLKNAVSLDTSPEFDAYSKVEVTISTDTNEKQVVTVGTDVGRTLEIEMLQCADAEQARTAAQRILNSLRGFQYQPFTATGCLLNPAAEIGDGVSINGIYSGIYNTEYDIGSMITASLTAPQDEAIEHEYSTKTSTNRVLTREMDKAYSKMKISSDAIEAEVVRATAAEGTLSSRITQNATDITAKVSKSGGTGGFSWTLTDSSWTVLSGTSEVFKVNSEGATVTGEIRATKGTIGGFTIGTSSIYKDIPSMESKTTQGVYIGTNGIKLGQNFEVSSSGIIKANSAEFSGTLKVGGDTIEADSLRGGAVNGNRLGSKISGYGTSKNKFKCEGFSIQELDVEDTLSASSIVATTGITSNGHVTANKLSYKKSSGNGYYQMSGASTVTIDGSTYTFATVVSRG